jgi:hypothetical protein
MKKIFALVCLPVVLSIALSTPVSAQTADDDPFKPVCGISHTPLTGEEDPCSDSTQTTGISHTPAPEEPSINAVTLLLDGAALLFSITSY